MCASALYDEVVALGFSRTYPTFTRALRRLKLRPHQRLERPALGGHVVQCAQLANAVEAGTGRAGPSPAAPASGATGPGLVLRPLSRLAAQEDLVADLGHPRLEPHLRLAVARRHGEMVDPVVSAVWIARSAVS